MNGKSWEFNEPTRFAGRPRRTATRRPRRSLPVETEKSEEKSEARRIPTEIKRLLSFVVGALERKISMLNRT